MARLTTLTRARQFRPALEKLEDRTQPAAFTGLGVANQFAVLGLRNTDISHVRAVVAGDEGVSRGGSLSNDARSTITGDVFEAARRQYSGRGVLGGSLVVDPALLRQANADARAASRAADALAPTQTLTGVTKATTVNGKGGLNVIDINGNVTASLTLSGSANDVFVINVSGDLDLGAREVLGLGGAVTADHVLYNFLGRHTVSAADRSVVNGTLLALNSDVEVDGTLNGEVIGGGSTIRLAGHAQVNEVPFVLPPPPSAGVTSLSGSIYADANSNGARDVGETGVVGFTVLLTGTDVNGNAVSLSATTDADGNYSFTGLAAGTYTLTKQVPPFGFPNGQATAGKVNGVTDGTVQDSLHITNIVLHQGDVGTGYNFANLNMG